METKLSVTIVNYNQKYFPRLCVEALKKSDVDFDFEIIVCDNNSNDESIVFLKKANADGDIKLVLPGKNLGYGGGHNLAAKQSKGKYILILNTDITVEPDTLQKLVDYLDEHNDTGMVGSKLLYHNGEVQKSCRRYFKFFDLFIKRTFLKKIPPFKKRYENYIMEDFDHNKTQEVDLITGAFMMMPRKVFDEVGGFDERYFLFMEDFDLCRKTHNAGYKVVYYPEASSTHYHKRLSDGNLFKLIFNKISWYHLASAIKYHWKWRNG
ncbi:glycosyltransferase family 2 protein [Candidatus Peregrinibacteria bacterium]|nr:glycosyltransferase family 2 protein [Candidatus Peregrinibacteria bacterium]